MSATSFHSVTTHEQFHGTQGAKQVNPVFLLLPASWFMVALATAITALMWHVPWGLAVSLLSLSALGAIALLFKAVDSIVSDGLFLRPLMMIVAMVPLVTVGYKTLGML